MRKPVIGIWILSGLFFVACGERDADIGSTQADEAFFDLKSFVAHETERLQEGGYRLNKTIVLNGAYEEIFVSEVNWEDELRPLLNSDINKSSWVGKFSIDTTTTEAGETTLNYTSTEKKIPVKRLTVVTDQLGRVLSIEAEYNQRNPLMHAHQLLSYQPATGYRVIGRQKALILKEHTYSIQAELLPKAP